MLTKTQSILFIVSYCEHLQPKSWFSKSLNFFNSGKLVKDEVRGTEAVGLETYMAYVNSMGGIHMALLVLFFFLLMFFTMTFNNWWLSYWLGQGSGVSVQICQCLAGVC